jgi:hypothetical protein
LRMASRCASSLFETGCCAASERLNEIMNAVASDVVERKGGRVKVEIAVFTGELLGAETKCEGKPFLISSHNIEYSII